MTSTEVPALPPPVEPGELPPAVAAERAATLAAIRVERRTQDLAAARELERVAHWADLHRVDLPPAVAAEALVSGQPVPVPAAVTAPRVVSLLGGPLLGTEGVLQLAGEGTFAVTEFAVCEVATTLGLSEISARRFVGQTVELRERLPRCWVQVHAGALPAWKARQIAAETI